MAKDPPTREQLEKWIDESRLGDFINAKGQTFKKMGLSLEKLTKKKAIDLAVGEPNLLRRPILVKGKKVVFGYKPEEY